MTDDATTINPAHKDGAGGLLDACDDVIGGFWGNHISWSNNEQFSEPERELFSVYGHKPFDQQPKLGDKITAEMQHSWILFEVTDIRHEHDPKDMFFAELKPVFQVLKADIQKALSS